jgi:hypothetical protein
VSRRTAVVVVLAALALALSGCVSLPQSGSVKSVSVDERGDGDTLVDYTPGGPKKGSAPVPLVQSFVTAMTATPLNTFVARQFLTSGSNDTWVPEKGTLVFGSKRVVTEPDGHVSLQLTDVVELDARGSWKGDPTHGRGITFDLKLVKENGQWRISNPPDRLLIPQSHFEAQYQQYFLYFFDRSAQVLVPEPVYVPRGAQASTLLVAGLLKGPEGGLRDVERSFVPSGTALDGISVPVSREGTAEVPLSHQVLDVDDNQLNLLFAQLAWTLGQIPGVERMRVTVDGTPLDLPGARADVNVGEWSQFDPAVAWASTSLFGLRQGRAVTIEGSTERRVSGPFGALSLGLRSLGVDLPARHLAAVTADGHRALEADRDQATGNPSPADVRTVYAGGTDLLRPEYDLYGQLWLVDRTSSGAVVSVVRAGTRRVVTVPGVSGHDVERFVLSRDGTRMVAQIGSTSGDRLVAARIEHDPSGRVLGATTAEQVPLTGAAVSDIHDVAWRTPGTLAVLAGQPDRASQVLIAKIDGSSTPEDLGTDAELFRGDAVRVTTSPALGSPLYVGTSTGQLFSLAATGRWTGTSIPLGLTATTFVG